MGLPRHFLAHVVTVGVLAIFVTACGTSVEVSARMYSGPAAPADSATTAPSPPVAHLGNTIADPYIETPPTSTTSVPTLRRAPRKLNAPEPTRITQSPSVVGPAPACDWRDSLERATSDRDAEWIILDTGAWGRAEVPGNRIWIAPRTPCSKVYSVAVHEWVHHMQGIVYRDWAVTQRELAPYGGPEVVADCGALLLGATWIRYGCPGGTSSDAALAILRAERPDSHR